MTWMDLPRQLFHQALKYSSLPNLFFCLPAGDTADFISDDGRVFLILELGDP